MRSPAGVRPVLDAAGKTVGYLTSQPHLPPTPRSDTWIPNEKPAQSFWGAYYRGPVRAKRRSPT